MNEKIRPHWVKISEYYQYRRPRVCSMPHLQVIFDSIGNINKWVAVFNGDEFLIHSESLEEAMILGEQIYIEKLFASLKALGHEPILPEFDVRDKVYPMHKYAHEGAEWAMGDSFNPLEIRAYLTGDMYLLGHGRDLEELSGDVLFKTYDEGDARCKELNQEINNG